MRRNLTITFLFLLVISSVLFPLGYMVSQTNFEKRITTSDFFIEVDTPFSARMVDVDSNGKIYCIDWEGIVWSTTNNGTSWVNELDTNATDEGKQYKSLIVSSNDNVHVASGLQGIWRRNSSGWFKTLASTVSPWHFTENILTGDLYLQAHGNYIWNSTDNGNSWQIMFNLTLNPIDDHFHTVAFDNETQTLWAVLGDTEDLIRTWNETTGWISVSSGFIQPTSIMFDGDYAYFGPDASNYLYRILKNVTAPASETDFTIVLSLEEALYPNNQWMWDIRKIGNIYYAPTSYEDGYFFVSLDGLNWVRVYSEDGFFLPGEGETPEDEKAGWKGGIVSISSRLPLVFVSNMQLYILDVTENDIKSLYNQPFIRETANTITFEKAVSNGSNNLNIGEVGLTDINLTLTGLSLYELIENRTFEPGSNGSWTQDGYGTLSVTDSEAANGSYSLQDIVTAGTAFSSLVYPPDSESWNIASSGGGQYFFSAWLKTNVTWTGLSPKFYLDIRYRIDTAITTNPIRINITTAWNQFSHSIWVPDNATEISPQIAIYREDGVPREVYIDDVMFWGPLKTTVFDGGRQRFTSSTYTNSFNVSDTEIKTVNPNVTIAGATFSHSGTLNNGSSSSDFTLNSTHFLNGLEDYTSETGGEQVLLTVTSYTRHLNTSILNMDARNWVFAEKKYKYKIDVPFFNSNLIDNVRIAFVDNGDQWVIVKHTLPGNTTQLLNGTGLAYVRGAKSETVYLGLGEELLVKRVTFTITTLTNLIDSLNVDLLVYVEYEDGLALGWRKPRSNVFNLYSIGGAATLVTNGTAGRIQGGDVFDLYAISNVSGSHYAESTAVFRNLQHLKILPRVKFDRQANEPTPYFTLSYKMNYFVGDGWVTGFEIKIKENIQAAGSNRWFNWTVEFYQGSTLIRNETWYLFFVADSVTPSTNENSTGIFWLDMWFNRINASSIGGCRINAYQYPMNDASNEWLRWLTGSNWGISEQLPKDFLFMTDLLDRDGNVIHTQQIELVNVTCRLDITLAAGRATNLTASVGDYDIFDLSIGSDPFTGIQTPIFEETRVPSLPQGGLLGAIWSALTYVAKVIADALGPAVLRFFDTFVGFLDSIAGFFGAPGLFSQILDFFNSAWDWFLNSVTWVLSLLTTFFSALLLTMGKFTSLVADVVGQWIAMFQVFIGILDGAYTSGVSIWTDLGLATWILVGAILYPLYLMEVAATKGVNAAIAQVQFLLNIAAFLVNGFITVIQLIINLISSIIEAIPVVE